MKHRVLNFREHGRRVAAMEEDAAVAGSPNRLIAKRSTAARSANNKLTIQAAQGANNQLAENTATFTPEATTRVRRRGTSGQLSSSLPQWDEAARCTSALVPRWQPRRSGAS